MATTLLRAYCQVNTVTLQLENALLHGDGNKLGIHRRLDRLGYQVDRDGRIIPRGGQDGDDSGDGDADPDTDGDGFIGDTYVGPNIPEEHQIWYYHGDHLGSSTVITDRFGRNYEHLASRELSRVTPKHPDPVAIIDPTHTKKFPYTSPRS